jgi:ferredoxin-NADP reductase
VATTYAERKQQTYRQLAKLQAVLDKAEPDSLDHAFWAEILETVERLPKREQTHWKQNYGQMLRTAVRNVCTKIPDVMIEVPVLMPAALADQLAKTCVQRRVDSDSAVCEAITQWCKEKQS